MSTETALATAPVNPGFHKATSALATTLGISPAMMVDTLKKQCFPSMKPENITDAQLAAFISVANTLELNPLIPGMLYGYPTQNGGIAPMTGPDGVYKKLSEHAEVEGWEVEVFPADPSLPPTHATCRIFRKGRDKPLTKTVLLSEWKVGSNPNWNTRPRHMLELRALKQCARQIIHGIPMDMDELTISGMENVTPQGDAPTPEVQKRPDAPKRSPKGAAAVVENAPKLASTQGTAGSNVVEGEFTDNPAKAEAAQLEADLKAREAKLKADALKTTEPVKPVEPPVQTQADQAGQAAPPRVFLKDAEEITVVCTIKDFQSMMAKFKGVRQPLVQVELTGGFTTPLGKNAMHFGEYGGGTQVGNTDEVVPNPLYTKGTKAKFTLLGRLNTAIKDEVRIVPLITKIEAINTEASPANPDTDVG